MQEMRSIAVLATMSIAKRMLMTLVAVMMAVMMAIFLAELIAITVLQQSRTAGG